MDHTGKKRHTTHHPAKEAAAKEQAESPAAQPAHKAEESKRKEIKISIPEIKGVNLTTISAVAAILLLVMVTFQAFQAYSLTKKVDSLVEKAEEASKPAIIELTLIEADCAPCTSLAAIMAQVQSAKVEITKSLSLTSTDEHSRKLITDYSIQRLPAIVIKGEVDKASLSGFTKVADALVYQATPPYYDVQSGNVKGVVSITLVNASSCKECQDLMPAVQQLRTLVKVGGFKVVDKDSAEGRKLVTEYSMSRLPGILISSDINEYPISAQLAQAGTAKKDGTIALGATPPYYNVSEGRISGLAEVTLLNDSACAECYDVNMHIAILKQGFGVYVNSVKISDAQTAGGKSLISKYKIDAIPTLIINGDLSPYDRLNAIWPGVGTVENDGTHILRNMAGIPGNAYKNLTTGKVEANLPQQRAQQ